MLADFDRVVHRASRKPLDVANYCNVRCKHTAHDVLGDAEQEFGDVSVLDYGNDDIDNFQTRSCTIRMHEIALPRCSWSVVVAENNYWCHSHFHYGNYLWGNC